MKIDFKWALLGCAVVGFAIVVWADTNTKISRLTRGVVNVGGVGSTDGKTVIVSDDPTNEYHLVPITATVAGVATAYTNTFGTSFLSAPNFAIAAATTKTQNAITNVAVTVTTTNIIVTGLSTNVPNNVNILVYGPTRTGTFQ